MGKTIFRDTGNSWVRTNNSWASRGRGCDRSIFQIDAGFGAERARVAGIGALWEG